MDFFIEKRCGQHYAKNTPQIVMKFCGCVWHHEMTNRLDFGSDRIKCQGQGHKKVKIVFLAIKVSILFRFTSN